MNRKNNILIVGGTGFIGHHLAKKSLTKGWQVTSISSKPPKKIRYLSKVKYIICDITKKKSLKRNIQKSFKYVVSLNDEVLNSAPRKEIPFIRNNDLKNLFMHSIRHEGIHAGHLSWLCKLHGIQTI